MRDTIRWIGQSGYVLNVRGKRLVIDPYLSDAVFKAEGLRRLVDPPCRPEELKADIIVCTHDHADHLDEDTLRRTNQGGTLYCGPASCVAHFRRMGIPLEQIQLLTRGTRGQFGDLVIRAVFAAHTPDSVGVVVMARDVAIYFTGDSEYDGRLAEVGVLLKIDILVCCINGKWANMDSLQAATLAGELKARIAIPCHYGMFAENTVDPHEFEAALAGSGTEYRELAYNQEYDVAALTA